MFLSKAFFKILVCKSNKTILIIIIPLIINNCGALYNKSNLNSRIHGIVKIEDFNGSLVRVTHKKQRNSIKALPLLISTGLKQDSSVFTLIEFKAYNKNNPINYEKIVMYNSNNHQWEWITSSYKKSFKKTKYFTEESYVSFITSKEEELFDFFNFPPVYVKFIGEIESFKKLEEEHLKSLRKTLGYAKTFNKSNF